MEEALIEHKNLGRVIFPSIFILFVVHAIAVFNNLYNLVQWIDIPLHLMWGSIGALLLYWLAYRFPGYINVEKSFLITLVMVLSWVALGGVVWEFSEFLYDLLVYVNGFSASPVQFSLDDTIADLAFDLSGAIIVVVAIRLSYHKNIQRT